MLLLPPGLGRWFFALALCIPALSANQDNYADSPQVDSLLRTGIRRVAFSCILKGDQPWALPWPCVNKFLRVVTHPRVFDPPTDLDAALEDLVSLLVSPSLVMLGEGPAHVEHLRRSVLEGRTAGNLVHDAHIAALCLEHGVRELLTADRDMTRFTGLRIRNPFLK